MNEPSHTSFDFSINYYCDIVAFFESYHVNDLKRDVSTYVMSIDMYVRIEKGENYLFNILLAKIKVLSNLGNV